ncbi:DUF1516 family protein [Paenibacillus contaminans]|uniref:DUF1516 domain-containing protein n=1 Tax=Paenibacillus contaminans TaxID=450362 RepID=A0A329MMS4_9BACL|nr:DUF1516 family protein [Paenibacillus contaminans]RAV20910.1 hypothetical protein DQG23_12525 [Paenibacillus contaminans]
MFNMFYQMHTGSWLITIILFILSFLFQGQKVTPMLLRLFYLIMLVSGISMLFILEFPLAFIIKGLLAVVMIGSMEMILGRKRRGEKTMPLWLVFVVLLAIVVLMGFNVISF